MADAMNAGEELLRATASRGAATLIRCDGAQHSASAVAGLALALQAELAAAGVARGERVLLALRDGPAFVAAFLGAMRGGFVPVPVSTLLPPKDVRFIARDAAVGPGVVDRARGAVDDQSL
jgi:acyl-CoA synthetase (AMP-forming)/AMP-acid ligase II